MMFSSFAMQLNAATTISVDACNLSGERKANVVVDIGYDSSYATRNYYATTNGYAQLTKVTANEIIIQNDDKEAVKSTGRYCSDEAKVPGTEASDLNEGHVIADSLGGVSNAYNITPQASGVNRSGGAQYAFEQEILNAERSGQQVTNFVMNITYPNSSTQIPSRYSVSYKINGVTQTYSFDNGGYASQSTTGSNSESCSVLANEYINSNGNKVKKYTSPSVNKVCTIVYYGNSNTQKSKVINYYTSGVLTSSDTYLYNTSGVRYQYDRKTFYTNGVVKYQKRAKYRSNNTAYVTDEWWFNSKGQKSRWDYTTTYSSGNDKYYIRAKYRANKTRYVSDEWYYNSSGVKTRWDYKTYHTNGQEKTYERAKYRVDGTRYVADKWYFNNIGKKSRWDYRSYHANGKTKTSTIAKYRSNGTRYYAEDYTYTSNGQKTSFTKRAYDTRGKVSSTKKYTYNTRSSSTVSYANCSAVKAAGKAPLYKGQPGYSTSLDRDRDGVACES